MTYICISKIDSLLIHRDRIRLYSKDKIYEIIREGEEYYLISVDNIKTKVKNFSIDEHLSIIFSDEALPPDFCEVIEDLRMG
jgi:hypothetical protein